MSLPTCQQRFSTGSSSRCMHATLAFGSKFAIFTKFRRQGPRHSDAVPLWMRCYDHRPNPTARRHEYWGDDAVR